MRKRGLLIGASLLGLAFATAATAQHTPPATEIYLVEITRDADGGIELGVPINVTNRKGYDNQPAFSPDGESIYYVAWGEKGPDVWVLDAEKRTHRLLRKTVDWEFSPTPIPGDEAVAVVKLNGPKHELWRYPLSAEEPPSHLLPDVDQAAFHAWIDGEHLLVHELGRPPHLLKLKVGPGKGEVLASYVGRTLKRVPGTGDVVFVHREGGAKIKRLNAESGEIETLIEPLPDREDFAVSGDGTLWTSDGEAIYVAAPGETEWQKVADLSDEVDEISRLDVHPDGTLLALVADE